MKRILLIVVLAVFACTGSFAQVNPTMPTTNLPTQPSPEYVETLKKYMEVSGAADMYKNLVPQMFAALKQQLPNVPADVWDSLEKELNTPTLFDDIVKAFAPVYEKLLTKEDLEEIMFKGSRNIDTCEYCKNAKCYARGGIQVCNPVWRGIKEG